MRLPKGRGAIITPINEFVLDDPDEASYLTGVTLLAGGGMSLYPRFV